MNSNRMLELEKEVLEHYPFLFDPNGKPIVNVLEPFILNKDPHVYPWFLGLPKDDAWFKIVNSIFQKSQEKHGKHQDIVLDCLECSDDPIQALHQLLKNYPSNNIHAFLEQVLTTFPPVSGYIQKSEKYKCKIQGINGDNLLSRFNRKEWLDSIRRNYGDTKATYALINKACDAHIGNYNSHSIGIIRSTQKPLQLHPQDEQKVVEYLIKKLNLAKIIKDEDRYPSLSEWESENLLQPFVQKAIIQTIQAASSKEQLHFLKKNEALTILMHATRQQIPLLTLRDEEYQSFRDTTPFSWIVQKWQNDKRWIKNAIRSFLHSANSVRGLVRQAGPLFEFQHSTPCTHELINAIREEPQIALVWAAILFEHKLYDLGRPLDIPYAKMLHRLVPSVAHTWMDSNGNECITALLNLHFPHIEATMIEGLSHAYAMLLDNENKIDTDIAILRSLIQQMCEKPQLELNLHSEIGMP